MHKYGAIWLSTVLFGRVMEATWGYAHMWSIFCWPATPQTCITQRSWIEQVDDSLNCEITWLHHYYQSINNRSACRENHSTVPIYQPTNQPAPTLPKSSLLAINNKSACHEGNWLYGPDSSEHMRPRYHCPVWMVSNQCDGEEHSSSYGCCLDMDQQ